MKLEVLAFDYNGTIAENGVLDPTVRGAIDRPRAQGIVVMLVIGRILEDLHPVAGDLRFVDAVVAAKAQAPVPDPIQDPDHISVAFLAGNVDRTMRPKGVDPFTRLDEPAVSLHERRTSDQTSKSCKTARGQLSVTDEHAPQF